MAQGLTIDALAKLVGAPNSTVAAAEKRGRDCRLLTALAIVRALGQSISGMQAKYSEAER